MIKNNFYPWLLSNLKISNLVQGLLQNGQDTDRQNFYFLYLTENENLALISFEDL